MNDFIIIKINKIEINPIRVNLFNSGLSAEVYFDLSKKIGLFAIVCVKSVHNCID